MFSKSACQVSRRWDDVGSFCKRLFGVVYVTRGDFHDGSEKRTASVHQILCQYWEKCYGNPRNDSTRLRGPKIESNTGVSMACPVQDRSHINWRRRTHRETHKLHNSWNCCANSRAHPSGLTSDHSRHCWGGGSWLWDTPTGSDGRIGHAPFRSQICVQDPDSWPEAVARRPPVSGEKPNLLLSPTHRTSLILHPVNSSCFLKWNWSWKDADSIPLRRSSPKCRKCLTLWQKRTSRKRSKNGGDGGNGVYMRERTTSRVTEADRPYGKFYDFYSVSPENFGSTLVCVCVCVYIYIYIYIRYWIVI